MHIFTFALGCPFKTCYSHCYKFPTEYFIINVSIKKNCSQITDPDCELVLSGRIVLNVWRLMRSELALTSYSAENLFFHVLHERVPKYDHRTLTQWWTSENANLDRKVPFSKFPLSNY